MAHTYKRCLKAVNKKEMKNVLLLLIDALSAPHLEAEMENGRLPTFSAIKQKSIYRDQCTTIFPSITQAALSSLATGSYPSQHDVLGSYWYDASAEKAIFFSADFGYILEKGIGRHIYDLIYHLNETMLGDVPTIFETLDHAGIDSTSINHLVFRGHHAHELNTPLLMSLLPKLPSKMTVKGPKQFMLGDFLNDPNEMDAKAAHTGLLNWLGFHDNNTIDVLQQLADSDSFSPFTLAYFPANDQRAHDEGPTIAHSKLEQLDQQLGDFIDMYGGLSSFLEKFVLVITGDHSQTSILADEKEGIIRLDDLFSDYALARTGHPWREQDQLMVCPNMRAAQLYFHNTKAELFEPVLERLASEPRIDQIIWRAQDEGYVCQSENGRLHFWQHTDNNSQPMGIDPYQNAWSWRGDLAVVDGQLTDGQLTFPNYPNAFERIAGLLDSRHSGAIWLTAKLGCEFVTNKVQHHAGGGSHGSLHLSDSQAPLLIAGAPKDFAIPQHVRLTDIKSFCLGLLELENR